MQLDMLLKIQWIHLLFCSLLKSGFEISSN